MVGDGGVGVATGDQVKDVTLTLGQLMQYFTTPRQKSGAVAQPFPQVGGDGGLKMASPVPTARMALSVSSLSAPLRT